MFDLTVQVLRPSHLLNYVMYRDGQDVEDSKNADSYQNSNDCKIQDR